MPIECLSSQSQVYCSSPAAWARIMFVCVTCPLNLSQIRLTEDARVCPSIGTAIAVYLAFLTLICSVHLMSLLPYLEFSTQVFALPNCLKTRTDQPCIQNNTLTMGSVKTELFPNGGWDTHHHIFDSRHPARAIVQSTSRLTLLRSSELPILARQAPHSTSSDSQRI